MNKNFKKTILLFMLLILPVTFYAQNDVTKFLDIPIDGYKPEMVQKLKSKGFIVLKSVCPLKLELILMPFQTTAVCCAVVPLLQPEKTHLERLYQQLQLYL